MQRFTTVDGKFVQVLHANTNHWVCVASNMNNEASVYDSMGGNFSKDTVLVKTMVVMVKLMAVQHQMNGKDYGLSALTFTTDFAEGIDPSDRNHILQCFRNNKINQFFARRHLCEEQFV